MLSWPCALLAGVDHPDAPSARKLDC